MVLSFTERYYVVVSHALGTSLVCLLFVKKLNGLFIQSVSSCQSGRIVYCDFVLRDVQYRTIGIYAPNGIEEGVGFFSDFFQHVSCDRRVVVLGDFNCVLNARDRANWARIQDKSSDMLSKLINANDLDDVCECLEANREVTFTRFQRSSHARLDRIYVSLDIIPRCHEYSVVPVSFSGHCLVLRRIGMNSKSRLFNWELWKLNGLLLKDEFFVDAVQGTFNERLTENFETIAEKWECLKQS